MDVREVLIVEAKAIVNGVSEASLWAGTQEQWRRLEDMVVVTLCYRRHIAHLLRRFPVPRRTLEQILP